MYQIITFWENSSTKSHNFIAFRPTRELAVLRLIFPVFHEFPTLFRSKVSQMRLRFVPFLVTLCYLEMKNVWWFISILPNFHLRSTFELMDYFQNFLWNCQDFYLPKSCFICSKCSTFWGNQKPPQIPALLVEEGGRVFHRFSTKKSQNLTLFVDLCHGKIEEISSKTLIFLSKKGFEFFWK